VIGSYSPVASFRSIIIIIIVITVQGSFLLSMISFGVDMKFVVILL